MTDAQDIPLIDAHVHIWSPESAPTAGPIMDACRNVAMNLVNIPHHRNHAIVENIQSLLIKLMYPNRVYASGGLYHNVEGLQFEETDFAAQARRLMLLAARHLCRAKGFRRSRRGLVSRPVPLSC